MDRDEAHRRAIRMGARPKKSVNKKCRFVVVGAERGNTKLDQILEWRSKGSTITEIDEEQFLGYIEEAKENQGAGGDR